jgi:hypothetical protein
MTTARQLKAPPVTPVRCAIYTRKSTEAWTPTCTCSRVSESPRHPRTPSNPHPGGLPPVRQGRRPGVFVRMG